MSVKFTKPNKRERAARAIARLYSGKLSQKDVNRVGEWQTESSDYRQEFLRTTHLLADMEGLRNAKQIQAILKESAAAGVPDNRRGPNRLLWSGLAVAAGLLLVLGVNYQALIAPFFNGSLDADGNVLRHVTRVGEQKRVDLPDGSVITLNTGSELLVSVSDQERAVTLVRGEVFFDVAPDPQRPFFVDVGTRRISVLGTQFNIHKLPEQFTLAVVEGVVSLHKVAEPLDAGAPAMRTQQGNTVHINSPAQYRLSAGWVAEFDAEENTLTVYTGADLNRIHSWRTGLVSFAGEPLYKVVRELNRYSGKKISIEDSGLVDIEVFASVRVDRINAALTSLERAYPIKLIYYFDRIGIVGSEKTRAR